MSTETLTTREYLTVLPEGLRSTPLLVIDLDVLEQDFGEFLAGFPGSRIFYAVKANPHPGIIRALAAMGCEFEVSSLGELKLLQSIGVPGARTITSNTVKAEAFVSEAWDYGVTHFGFDSEPEARKLARLAPGAEVSVRIAVPNAASDWPLDRKFGAGVDEAPGLVAYAKELGLTTAGLTFHVGSQCREVESWPEAMAIARDVWDRCRASGIALNTINAGGGIPVAYDHSDVPAIREVAETVREAHRELFPEAALWVEPGRAVVGRAGSMLCSVIGDTTRNGSRWVYLDAGVFHGLAEAMGGIRYSFLTDRNGERSTCTVAGPSCDSMDVVAEEAVLPRLSEGDIVAIPACGAYTTAYASEFNGFPGPQTVLTRGGAVVEA